MNTIFIFYTSEAGRWTGAHLLSSGLLVRNTKYCERHTTTQIKRIIHQVNNKTTVTSSYKHQQQVKHSFGPVISYLFTIWHKVRKFAKIYFKFFHQSPVFHNHCLLIDGKPISFPQRSDKGINTLQDVTGQQGLREFQDLQRSFDLPGTSVFFYLQLRAAMRAQGVP